MSPIEQPGRGIVSADRGEFAASPHGPTGPAPFGRDFSIEDRYTVAVYHSLRDIDGTRRPQDQQIQLEGDHLTVLRIIGPDELAVQVGSSDNSFIPIREGMVIQRRFSSFVVRLLGYRAGAVIPTPPTQAVFLVSYGAIVDLVGRKRTGFEPSMFTIKTTVDVNGADLLDPALIRTVYPTLGAIGSPVPSILRYGGTLRIHNRSQTTPIYLYAGFPDIAAPHQFGSTVDAAGWQIDPGQKEEFTFESSPRFRKKNPAIALSPFNVSLFAATLAGTADVAVLFSSGVSDQSDEEVDYGAATDAWFHPVPLGGR